MFFYRGTIECVMNTEFQRMIFDFYQKNKRDLPWRKTQNPYFILVSEIMLQQTQVLRVEPKYKEFIKRFPTLQSLVRASLLEVLTTWQGLGYNRRALFLKQTAEIIVREHFGNIPKDPYILQKLPGFGYATACSTIVFSYNLPLAFIETNIRRVFIHHFFEDKTEISDTEILPLVEKTIDRKNPRDFYYGLMDYGSFLGKKVVNPNRKSKRYTKQSRFEGSVRQVRGKILKALLQKTELTEQELIKKVNVTKRLFDNALFQLAKEGFIQRKKTTLSIKPMKKESNYVTA